MPIFQDSTGLSVKFFIQKDIPQEVQAELCETITSLGGRVEAKVPRQGYILVQPGTPEEERLRLCWTSNERPDRHFVPYTYVEACKIAGMLLKQIFVEDGTPISMHIHPSIANINARSALSSRIMHSGGNPHASAQSARVILADPNTEVFQHLVKTYQGVPGKYIESFLWVKKCIEKGIVVYTPLVYKNPGGRRPGEERTQFTEEDEEHLCNWIASKIPYKETGGRTGNRLYQQLCDLSNDPEYAWVSRHTWQSWRERYKKNAARLDTVIARIVDQKKPAPGEKGQYGYVRQPEEKAKRPRKKRPKAIDASMDEDYQGAVEALIGLPGLPASISSTLSSQMNMVGQQQMHAAPQPQGSGNMYHPLLPSHPVTQLQTLQNLPVRQSPTKEEMEENEDDPEWAVRIGDEPPPSWSKRKASSEQNDIVQPRKKLKIDEANSLTEKSSPETRPSGQLSASALVTLANIHVIDQSIRDIAKDFRFTLEEVQEYYDKCGEMERTRSRFQKMRDELQARFPLD
ncbi:hypothetical protein BDQ17DRAFT_1269058 [Cyathus striatus]|nr:hypothetical protein BDQ17DRAFT_1269058 [Cyathus striatus]